jgi:hypothetical protein
MSELVNVGKEYWINKGSVNLNQFSEFVSTSLVLLR